MKWLSLFIGVMVHVYAMDEAEVEAQIAQTQSIETLSQQMERAPKAYRQRYIEAIKARVAAENEAKRIELLESLTGRSRGGNGGYGHAQGGRGSGGGNGNGGGGNGGGRGGK